MKAILFSVFFIYTVSADTTTYYNSNNKISSTDSSTFGFAYYIFILALYAANITATIIMICKNYIPPVYHCLAIILLFVVPLFSSLILVCIKRSYMNRNPIVVSHGVVIQEIRQVPIVRFLIKYNKLGSTKSTNNL
jgi:hypothetical protein